MELETKAGGFKSKNWMIPLEGGEGYVESVADQEVLGLRQKVDCTFGDRISVKKKGAIKTQPGCEDGNTSQKWLRSKDDEEGFFTIKNLANGLLLTSKGKKKFTVTGMSKIPFWKQLRLMNPFVFL